MKISSFLPNNKKIRILILVLVIAGLGLAMFFIFFKNNSQEEKNQLNLALVEVDSVTKNYEDSDNDGAYDWEEALWPELDPNNPDSDGDGVLDGQYLRNKRALELRAELGITESNLTKSEELGRGLLSALLAIESEGGIDNVTDEQVTENVSEYIENLTLGKKLYTRDQLNLVEDTEENIFNYRDEIRRLFRTYPIATSDIELLLQGLEDPDSNKGRLRASAQKYQEYLTQLELVKTPYIIGARHTQLMNNVSQIGAALTNLTSDESDDLISFSISVQIEKILNQTSEAVVKINEFFEIVDEVEVF